MSVVRILGIDPGTLHCGYGVIDADKKGPERFVDAGTLEQPAKLPRHVRVGRLCVEIENLIRDTGPQLIAYEDGFAGPRAAINGAMGLAEVRGALFGAAARFEIELLGMKPAHVKRCVAGRGNASKGEVARHVRFLMGLRREPSPDAADALAVAITAAVHWRAEKRRAA